MDDSHLRIDESIGAALARAEQGEQVTLHRQGQPVAKLVPADPAWDREEARRAIQHMVELREGTNLGSFRFKDLIHAGHKY